MGRRLATLPMYDRPELRAATDALWQYLRDGLEAAGCVDVPPALCRDRSHADGWADDALLFSQACGYDVHLRMPGRLTPLGVARYRAEGCQGPTYRSAIVVRVDDEATALTDLRGRTAAYNEPTSHSGRVALAASVADHARDGRFFGRLVETGSHEASAEAVAGGIADVAALDCTSWALMRRARPALDAALTVIAFSPACPAPPFVAGPCASERERKVLVRALSRLGTEPRLVDVREALLIEDVEPVTAETYVACAELVERADGQGYDLLADTDAPTSSRP